MTKWISINHQKPPFDKPVRFLYPSGGWDIGTINEDFIRTHGITHWSEDTLVLFKQEVE